MSDLDALRIRRMLGRDDWGVPQQYGPTGWRYLAQDGDGVVIVSTMPWPLDDQQQSSTWIHASMSRMRRVPTYDEMLLLHRAVWRGNGWSYQMHPPADQHINHHPYTLHLWGRLDGAPLMPNFAARFGSI